MVTTMAEREIGFYESMASPTLSKLRERQQAAKAKAAEAARPRVLAIDRGPPPKNYDSIVNGPWRRHVEVYEFAAPPEKPIEERGKLYRPSEKAWCEWYYGDGARRRFPWD